ncbi:MAG: hypothetical protein AAF568_03400 [Pseudomonadota bacterium]
MYIRFVCGFEHPHADAELGIFFAIDLIDFKDQPQWLITEFWRAYCEFPTLGVPRCVGYSSGTRDGRRALCWLRSQSRDHVAALRHLGWAITELGVPIAEISTQSPGHIIHRDENQVVALPQGGLPRAFPRRSRRKPL